MFCKKCGIKLVDDSIFCYKCGCKQDETNYEIESLKNDSKNVIDSYLEYKKHMAVYEDSYRWVRCKICGNHTTQFDGEYLECGLCKSLDVVYRDDMPFSTLGITTLEIKLEKESLNCRTPITDAILIAHKEWLKGDEDFTNPNYNNLLSTKPQDHPFIIMRNWVIDTNRQLTIDPNVVKDYYFPNQLIILTPPSKKDSIYTYNVKSNDFTKCPSCGTENISPISTIKKLSNLITLGLVSKFVGKSYMCKNCKYYW